MGLDYLMRKYILSCVNRTYNFFEDCHSHLFSNSLTFQVFSKFPWPSTNFPDFSLTWKTFHCPDFSPLTVATLLKYSVKIIRENKAINLWKLTNHFKIFFFFCICASSSPPMSRIAPLASLSKLLPSLNLKINIELLTFYFPMTFL